MALDRERLRYMALMALDEIAEACRDAPAERSMSLRFLLAWAHAESGGEAADKWLFDGFWKAATSPATDVAHKAMIDRYCRSSSAQSCLNGICRVLGYERTATFEQEMRKARQALRANVPTPNQPSSH